MQLTDTIVERKSQEQNGLYSVEMMRYTVVLDIVWGRRKASLEKLKVFLCKFYFRRL